MNKQNNDYFSLANSKSIPNSYSADFSSTEDKRTKSVMFNTTMMGTNPLNVINTKENHIVDQNKPYRTIIRRKIIDG